MGDRASELGLGAGEHALSFLAPDRRVTALWSDASPRRLSVAAHAAVSETTLVLPDGGVVAEPPGRAQLVELGAAPVLLVERR